MVYVTTKRQSIAIHERKTKEARREGTTLIAKKDQGSARAIPSCWKVMEEVHWRVGYPGNVDYKV